MSGMSSTSDSFYWMIMVINQMLSLTNLVLTLSSSHHTMH